MSKGPRSRLGRIFFKQVWENLSIKINKESNNNLFNKTKIHESLLKINKQINKKEG